MFKQRQQKKKVERDPWREVRCLSGPASTARIGMDRRGLRRGGQGTSGGLMRYSLAAVVGARPHLVVG